MNRSCERRHFPKSQSGYAILNGYKDDIHFVAFSLFFSGDGVLKNIVINQSRRLLSLNYGENNAVEVGLILDDC
tara:strand:+ start:721 stop:942 length:222 start_codon:yes stop_codon:yes gene_type:complete